MRRSSNRRSGHTSAAYHHQPSRQSSSSLSSVAADTAPPPPPITSDYNHPLMNISGTKPFAEGALSNSPGNTSTTSVGVVPKEIGGGEVTVPSSSTTRATGIKSSDISNVLIDDVVVRNGPPILNDVPISSSMTGFPQSRPSTRATHKNSSGNIPHSIFESLAGESGGYYSGRPPPTDRPSHRRGAAGFNNQNTEDWSVRQPQRTSGMSWRRSISDRQTIPDIQTTRNSGYPQHTTQLGNDSENPRLSSPASSDFRDPDGRHHRPNNRQNNSQVPINDQGWQSTGNRRRHSGSTSGHLNVGPPAGTPNTASTTIPTDTTTTMLTTPVMTPSGVGGIPSPHWNKDSGNIDLAGSSTTTNRFDYQLVQQWLQARAIAVISEYRAQQSRRRNISSPGDSNINNSGLSMGSDRHTTHGSIRLVEVTQRPPVQPPREDFLQQLQQALSDVAGNNVPYQMHNLEYPATMGPGWGFNRQPLQPQESKRSAAIMYNPHQQQPMVAPAYSIVTDGMLYYQAAPAPPHPAFGVDMSMFGFQQQAALQQQMMVLMSNPGGGIPMMPVSTMPVREEDQSRPEA